MISPPTVWSGSLMESFIVVLIGNSGSFFGISGIDKMENRRQLIPFPINSIRFYEILVELLPAIIESVPIMSTQTARTYPEITPKTTT